METGDLLKIDALPVPLAARPDEVSEEEIKSLHEALDAAIAAVVRGAGLDPDLLTSRVPPAAATSR